MRGQTGRKHRGTRDRVEITRGYEAVYRKAPKTQTGRNKGDTHRQVESTRDPNRCIAEQNR